jgi:molecular chaperone HtpG
MNALENKLSKQNPNLLAQLNKTVEEVSLLLTKYDTNFPKYTDHSINHTKQVYDLAAQLLTKEEIDNLNEDEIYVLSVACYLHDIGMCIPEEKIKEINGTEEFLQYKQAFPNLTIEDYIRDIHHELSNKFILEEWKLLNIPDEKYATAIGLVAQGHRKVDLGNLEEYKTKFFVKNGRDFVCLPFLASVIRVADELDVTNIRTPALLNKYYLPNNEFSRKEWFKHIATTQINFTEDYVSFQVKCSDHNMLAALETQFEKIQKTINYAQKIIRTIGNTEARRFCLNLMRVIPNYEYINFDPKGIKFSFDVQNVTKTFVGEDLYNDSLAAVREGIQNSIDSCLYRKKIGNEGYTPSISVSISSDKLVIKDNGIGMDEFIIENFFGRLGSSFYEQEQVKSKFDAIGQFGVGVFSYFLLSDFIEISTKSENGPSLKFRINNDPKNYFHFFDKSDQVEQGTTVTFYLKASIINLGKIGDVERYIRNNFRFIEIPIEFSDSNNTSSFSCQAFDLESSIEINQRIEIEHKNRVNDFELLPVRISNEGFIGECGVIIQKMNPGFSFNNTTHYLDHSSFKTGGPTMYSEIGICQKGVFIKNYGGDLLSCLVGNINLTRKERLNINRQEFTNKERITAIINQFEIRIIEVLFERLKKTHSKRLAVLTNEFLYSYLDFNSIPKPDQLKHVLMNCLFFQVYFEGKKRTVQLNQIIERYESFLLIGSSEKGKDISQYFKLPVIIFKIESPSGQPYKTIMNLFFRVFKYNTSLVSQGNLSYQKFSHSIENIESIKALREFKSKVFPYREEFQPCDNELLMANIWAGKKRSKVYSRDMYCYNTNSAFLKKLIPHLKAITDNHEFTRICRSCFDNISEYYVVFSGDRAYDHLENIVQKLNKIVEPLRQIGLVHEFKKTDFK